MSIATDLMMMYYAQTADPLPSAYRRVAYLESPAASDRPYIETGVYGGNSNLEIEIEFRYTGQYNWAPIYRSYAAEDTNCTRMILSNATGYIIDYINSKSSGGGRSLPANAATWHNFKLAKTWCVYDGISGAGGNNNIEGNPLPQNALIANIRMFPDYYIGTGVAVEIRKFKVKDNGVLIRDYIPCVRKSDSTPGMYDLCKSISAKTNSSFYIRDNNTGQFTWQEI